MKIIYPEDSTECAECGHLHYYGADYGYGLCPVEGCGCKGQKGARYDETLGTGRPAPTLQERMKATIEKLDIPHKRIEVYGRQVVITCWSEAAAKRYFMVMRRFCTKVRGPLQSVEENKVNRGTVLRPTMHNVWRVHGTI